MLSSRGGKVNMNNFKLEENLVSLYDDQPVAFCIEVLTNI